MPTYYERLQQKLLRAFSPVQLQLEDDSNRHKGHAGSHPSGETHFSVLVVSGAFQGKSRVARHRLVYDTVTEELKERVHALQVTALTPQEYEAKKL